MMLHARFSPSITLLVVTSLTSISCKGREPESGETGITATESDTNSDTESFDLGGSASATMTGASAEGGSGCADVSVTVEPQTPTIVLLVDQSGSMTADFMGMARWDALYTTLMDPVDGVIKPLEADMRFGLSLYTSMDGDAGGTCPMLTEVGPALNNHAAMDAVFGPAMPIDETPTGESLALVAQALDAFPEEGPKAIVLATDGQPDTCAVPNPQEGEPESIAAAEMAFDLGIKTFVLSVGPDVAQTHLQEMANVGVGKDPQAANPAPYWQALDAAELGNAFDEIIGGFVSCTFQLDGIVQLEDFCDGTVWLDGVELQCPVEWELLDEQTIEILGDACMKLKDGKSHMVQAQFPCGSVDIP